MVVGPVPTAVAGPVPVVVGVAGPAPAGPAPPARWSGGAVLGRRSVAGPVPPAIGTVGPAVGAPGPPTRSHPRRRRPGRDGATAGCRCSARRPRRCSARLHPHRSAGRSPALHRRQLPAAPAARRPPACEPPASPLGAWAEGRTAAGTRRDRWTKSAEPFSRRSSNRCRRVPALPPAAPRRAPPDRWNRRHRPVLPGRRQPDRAATTRGRARRGPWRAPPRGPARSSGAAPTSASARAPGPSPGSRPRAASP